MKEKLIRTVKTPFDCHICDWAYVDIIRKTHGKYDQFFCKCRQCKRQTKLYNTPFEAHQAFKDQTK